MHNSPSSQIGRSNPSKIEINHCNSANYREIVSRERPSFKHRLMPVYLHQEYQSEDMPRLLVAHRDF